MISIVLIGSPGAGKGTQAKKLADYFDMVHLSTGDMLRQEVDLKTDLGISARKYMDEGKLVPDSLIVDLVRKKLKEYNNRSGFIFDGFPRNVEQARILDEMLFKYDYKKPFVINIQVSDDIVIERLSGRRFCKSCGKIYHIKYALPKVDERCDNCGIKLSQRDDDKVEVVSDRLTVYHKYTLPLLEYYENSGNLFNVNGEAEAESVFESIKGILVDHIKK